eukprot:comp23395_c0_seq1/m.38784 comp23395_c0_seq1/g.38784  ORF comp23395_c0_seq1/g.38784 comp23395_c0_seq1/m.38784 type:complete len:843 (-) comp23395_c0_seq1:236-2764(-)
MGDERKRRQSDYSGLPSSKRPSIADRKAAEEEEENDDDTFGGTEGLITVQKKRLVEKLHFLEKVKLKEKDDEIQRLREGKEKYHSVLAAFNNCWDQLNQDVAIMLARFDKDPISSAIFQETGAKPPGQTYFERLNVSSDKRDEKTAERIAHTKKLVGRLADEIEKARKINDAVYGKIRGMAGSDEVMEELQQDNAKMHEDRSHLEEQLMAVQRHLTATNLKVTDLQEIAEKSKERVTELTEEEEYIRMQNEMLHQKVRKLRSQIGEAEARAKEAEAGSVPAAGTAGQTAATGAPVVVENAEVQQQLDELRKLAEGRLKELEQVREEKVKERQELDKLKATYVNPTDAPQYKILQTQYAVALKELQDLRAANEGLQKELSTVLLTRRTEIDHLESGDKEFKNKMEEELRQAESRALALMNERDSLQFQMKKMGNGREQENLMTEMRQLIINLQNHNSRQKKEIQRYKQKFEELRAKEETGQDGGEEGGATEGQGAGDLERRPSLDEGASVVDLREALRKAEQEKRELLGQVESLKRAVRSPRDPSQATANEKKMQEEIMRLREKLRSGGGRDGGDRNMEKTVNELQQKLQSKDQEEMALMNEMEVIGKAYEEMQEQNARLMAQLQQKEDSNFHLMSQQIKGGQLQQLMKEERDALETRLNALQTLCESTTTTLRKMEEKERNLREQLAALEKDAWLKQQAMEMHRKKAVDAAQEAKEKGISLDRATQQQEEMSKSLAQRTEAMEKEAHARKRLEEELSSVEGRLKRSQTSGDGPNALLEEEIRQYKEMVNCSLCKRRRKNGVITKCFHSFCLQCIQERYDNRMRKCPTCLDPFGQNDIHQIFL